MMHSINSLQQFFQTYRSQIPQLVDHEAQLEQILKQDRQLELSLAALYDQIYPLIEKELWESDHFDEMLEIYQSLFREQELLINSSDTDERYDFILSIPIADRPEHLTACLECIFQLCRLYSYGGKSDALFAKISVVIVEDSKNKEHIERDIALAEEYTKKGLQVYHYGLTEQYELMLKIPAELRQGVSSIIGDPSTENFYHKGQAITRNLSYLKALQLTEKKHNTLYFFVDSDQLLQVNLTGVDGDRAVYGLNYFYYINRIFKENDIAILTGKLVGDPPVSPSVMTVNFLDDVTAFLQQLSHYEAQQSCQFHPQDRIKPGDAAYHDMAQLFGFKNHKKTYDYYCPLKHKDNDEHDHIACLKSFSERINYFFFGEHLTRKTYFNYKHSLTDISPARTIYPGNYIVNNEGLKYIIPFGKLRLRMSGPTAGRLIQAEIKQRFASSNLPMLHTRTLQSDFKDEFRPGVEDNLENIDLGDEFERQFFGDLMLFTVARLTGSDGKKEQLLSETFAIVENELLELYENKHNNVIQKCDELSLLVNNKKLWWNQNEAMLESVGQLQQFIKNVQHNFSKQSKVYQRIQSAQHRQKKIAQMIEVLLNYRHDRNAWDKMLDQFN